MGLLDNTTQQGYYQGNDYGNYQFTSLDDVIDQFIIAYVGEDKIIPKVKRVDVRFHAQRALQELSFDTLKSCKGQEITVPASLQMVLPQDYVNYTKISWVDSAGIKHLMYPASKTSNPTPILQNPDDKYSLTAVGNLNPPAASINLDAVYTNITANMVVTGPNIPPNSFVQTATHGLGVTRITLADAANTFTWVTVYPTYVGKETLTFTNIDGSLIKEQKSAAILNGVSFAALDNKITAASVADATRVTVGMFVSHGGFASEAAVIDVQGAVITTSILSIDDSTGGSDEVTFYLPVEDSAAWESYKSGSPSENQDDYQDDTYWPMEGSRFGLDPQHAQSNGSFYIDCVSGKIHFSSNIAGKTVILDYISDSLGTDGEMQVHKFAEEAMYKWIAHAVLSTRANVQEYVVNRFKKERFAAIRTAKLRLSNLKLEELTQILRGKSKQIKH